MPGIQRQLPPDAGLGIGLGRIAHTCACRSDRSRPWCRRAINSVPGVLPGPGALMICSGYADDASSSSRTSSTSIDPRRKSVPVTSNHWCFQLDVERDAAAAFWLEIAERRRGAQAGGVDLVEERRRQEEARAGRQPRSSSPAQAAWRATETRGLKKSPKSLSRSTRPLAEAEATSAARNRPARTATVDGVAVVESRECRELR